MRINRVGVWLASLFITFPALAQKGLPKPALIPEPQEVRLQNAYLRVPKVMPHNIVGRSVEDGLLLSLLRDIFPEHRATSTKEAFLRFRLSPEIKHEEGYELNVHPQGIDIVAKTYLGYRHALQTLRQLLVAGKGYRYAHIKDAPRFAYRGLMLDVSRHFFPADYIKSLLDEMARLKLNRFHWHLVDGGGWRIESKHYPLLTERAAYRSESAWDAWWHAGDRRFTSPQDPKAYGGYYTQDEIRDVVAHATKLGITIVPEIELPGHSTELIHAYPELICPQATYKDASDVCIGNEATFTFFERILDETMELFPSEYIHIGGDEAAMNHWGQCPRCQERIKNEGLKDLHELQSYMIRRIEQYLNSKGRKIIGWDEILMGGLAPNATVMSWRGESGGIAAAQAGHDVVMTPNGNLYLDYYQSEAVDEPRAIGGYVTLEKVYRYDPIPQSLTKEQQRYILGVQANLWTEYVHTPEEVSYMFFPRALALAEVAWTATTRKDYARFRYAATQYLSGLAMRGHKPYPMRGITAHQYYKEGKGTGEMLLQLTPERSDAVVRYSFVGSPSAQDPILRPETFISNKKARCTVYANVFKGKQRLLPTDRVYRLDNHKGLRAKVHYKSQWNTKYPAGGSRTLNDGLWGSPTYLDGRWQGFTEPMDVVFELQGLTTLESVEMRFMAEREQWVYMPKTVEVLISEDGEHYTSLGVLTPKTSDDNPRPVFETFKFATNQQARFVRIKASIDRSPGHFIFCDEVIIH